MKKEKEGVSTILKGFVIGGTMLVPGVSGGSMAMILGIYKRLINSVSSFFKHKRKSAVFLSFILIGAFGGMIVCAKPLLALIERYPKPTLFFFMGAVVGGIPMMYREAKVERLSARNILYILSGIAIIALFSLLPTDSIISEMTPGIGHAIYLIAAGFIAAIALVLPGISVSHMLLLMGLYNDTITAVSELKILFLLPIALGLLLGIILTTKLLERLMTRYPCATYLIIIGFILGSLSETFPGMPMGIEWLLCLLTAAAGFACVFSLSLYDKGRRAES